MPAILLKLLSYFASDPNKVLKILFITVMLPLCIGVVMFLGPLGIWSHIPMVKEEQRTLYHEVIHEIESQTEVFIDYHALVAIHAVMYEQSFSKINITKIRDLAWRFIHEYEELVPDTCTDEDGESYDCSYYVTVYELHPLETVVNGLIADRLLQNGDLEHVERYIQFAGISDNTKLPNDFVLIEGSNDWIWPSTSTLVTSNYGPRDAPCWGCSSYHKGTDIGGPTGTPIMSMADGTVESARYESCGGNTILINHGNGIKSRYLHLNTMSVNSGREVRAGQPIGTLGNTGTCTTGPHLHWELYVNGQTVDPLGYFPNQDPRRR